MTPSPFRSRFRPLSDRNRDKNGVGLLLLLVGLAVVGACSRERTPPPATTPTTTTTTTAACGGVTDPAPAGGSSGAITFGGVERTYLLHVPASYDPEKPIPVVFNFHGHGSSAQNQMSYADFRPLAEREGFAVVAPDGQGSPRRFTLLGATATEADDVEFATALVDHLADRLCLDDRRIFATGMSNGGALSSVLACRAADRFAATAAVAAVIYVPPCSGPTKPAPVVAMMGTADPVVPYAGGRVNCCGNPEIPATEDTMKRFAERHGCDAAPTEERPHPTILRRTWTACDDAGAVELYAIEGGGHTWPGATFDLESRGLGRTTPDLVATETIWAFFTAHPRPPT